MGEVGPAVDPGTALFDERLVDGARNVACHDRTTAKVDGFSVDNRMLLDNAVDCHGSPVGAERALDGAVNHDRVAGGNHVATHHRARIDRHGFACGEYATANCRVDGDCLTCSKHVLADRIPDTNMLAGDNRITGNGTPDSHIVAGAKEGVLD